MPSTCFCTFFWSRELAWKFNNSYKNDKCALAQQFRSRYRTGTLTDSSVCACKGSPAVSFVIAKKKKALETARCQAVGIASENHEQFTVEHSAVGKRMRRPGLRPPESLSCVAKWKNEDHIFAFAFICVNISKYTQGISNSSCSRKENSVARRETYPLIYFFYHEPWECSNF